MTPRRIGRYTLFQPISHGGTAAVHYGRREAPGTTGDLAPVAVKRLLPGLAESDAYVAMIVDEARIAGFIRHPNVVRILDVVEDEGEPIIVFEYVHGTSLAHLLRILREDNRRMDPEIAAAIAEGALRGLHAAHEAHDDAGNALEIVHRDVSPQNILLDESGLARVTDFGVAKARGRLQRTTETGALKGKLGYLAPEQIHGSVSRQTDVFAMGIVLWEMLVGDRLFTGDNEGALLAATLGGRIDAPRKRGAQCSRELELVVLKALEREPEMRFATAEDMADAIVAATRVASPAEVAEWLESVAGKVLAERSAIMTEIASHVRPSASATRVDRDFRPPAAARRSAPSSSELPTVVIPPKRATRARFVAFVVGLVAVSAGAATLVRRASSTEVPPPSAEPAAPVNAVPVTDRASVSAASPSTEAQVEAPAAPSSTTRALRVAPRPNASAPSADARRAKKPAPDCSIPYEVDAQGRKIWRRECFDRKGP